MRTALVVDDNPDIRFLLSQALSKKGYLVEQAENGNVAREKLLKGLKPCLILLDILMPVMDGNQFLEWKNQSPEHMDFPVIVISATGVSTALKGTRGYLQKPVEIKSVLKVAEEHCCEQEGA